MRPYQRRLGAQALTTSLTTRCELTGDIVNGTVGGVKVTVTHDEKSPDELLWELAYTERRDLSIVRQRVSVTALREALLKDGTLVNQDRLTFIVSGEGVNARLYVGAFFPHQVHLVTGLSREAVEKFCTNLS